MPIKGPFFCDCSEKCKASRKEVSYSTLKRHQRQARGSAKVSNSHSVLQLRVESSEPPKATTPTLPTDLRQDPIEPSATRIASTSTFPFVQRQTPSAPAVDVRPSTSRLATPAVKGESNADLLASSLTQTTSLYQHVSNTWIGHRYEG